MPLNLITETVTEVRTLIETTTEGGKPSYFIEGIFMQGDQKNQNGRIYRTETLAREMQRYQKEYIERKRAFGELGHPPSPTVNLDRVSHMISDLHQDGNNFVGKAKVMVHTPMGNIVKALIDEEAQLGVSSRGVGSLVKSQDDIMVVQDDFYFTTVDIVADPSAHDAFVRGVMEGKAWVWESGVLKECALENVVHRIEKAHVPTMSQEERSKILTEEFGRYLKALRYSVRSNFR